MRKIISILLLAVVSSSQVQAGELAKNKDTLYRTCVPACITQQQENSVNPVFLELPFVMESYCSCYCARTALQTTSANVEQFNRAAKEGRSPTSIPIFAKRIKNNSLFCQKIVTEK